MATTKDELLIAQKIVRTRIQSIESNVTALIAQKDKLISEDMRLQQLIESIPEVQQGAGV